MNAIYKVIFNRATGQPVVVSELGKGKVKCKSKKNDLVRIFSKFIRNSSLSLSLVFPNYVLATDYTIASSITTSGFNNKAGSISVNGDTINLIGSTVFTGSQGTNFRKYDITDAYNLGYATGANDPNLLFTLEFGNKTNSIAVPDAITSGTTTINVFSNANVQENVAGSIPKYDIYFPTKQGEGPFIDVELANVTGGGVLNFNVGGKIGDTSVKNTAYINVKNGVAHWNSKNEVTFAGNEAGTVYGSLTPYTTTVLTHNYAGTFTVTTSDGIQTHTVNNISDLQNYNNWLINQLENGKLGSGQNAQANYDAAIALAVLSNQNQYTINPDPLSISATDPLYSSTGTRAAMLATGVDAKAIIGSTGEITLLAGNGLVASNGAVVVNDGVLTTYGSRIGNGIYASSGATAINNGVRNVGQLSGVRTESGNDVVTGSGSNYINNGIINIAGWTYSSSYAANSIGLLINDGAQAQNNGTFNIGNALTIGPALLAGVHLNKSAGSFINDKNGVMYLGRLAGFDVSLQPLVRGGGDVEQPNGGKIIHVTGQNSIVDNKGSLIIGDKVQNGIAINVDTTDKVNVVNNGNIIVNGHYNATPGANYGIVSASNASDTIVDNAGVIDLLGINSIGIMVSNGSLASSTGVINVSGKVDPSSGLRNYGLYSKDTNSKISLSGTVNLSGDGAIGVHVRNGGAISLTDNAAVNFFSGEKQIGYFIHGSGSQIINSSKSVQDVSSDNSTLMRLDGGATFTGSSASGSSMVASGKDSQILVATGTGTSVNTGSLTLDLLGTGSTGVLIEGGATGLIDANTALQLNNASAIAAIADGNGYDLTGALTTTGDSSTKLNSAAALSSTQNKVTGYIARNGAALENSGSISFDGENTIGIEVLDGSAGTNSGSITLNDGGVGLKASSSNLITTVNNTGDLTLKGGADKNRTTGILASGKTVTVNMTGGTIRLEGQGAIGVAVHDGATVNLAGTAMPDFAGNNVSNQIAFLISGAGSTLNTQGTAMMDANGEGSTLFRVENKASQQGVLSYTVSGNNARGIWATGSGTLVKAAAGSQLSIAGTGAQGLFVAGGADATLEKGVTADLTGTGAVVGVVDGNEYDLAGVVTNSNMGTILTNEASITSGLAGATAFITQNQGKLINTGRIDLSNGSGNTGIKVISGQFENKASDITVSGVAVDVEGANSKVFSTGGSIIATDGEAAIRLSQGASLDLVGSGMGVVEGRGSAHGVLLDTGAKGLIINGARIDVNATGASGNGIENRAEIAGIQLNGTTINVQDGKGVRTSATLAQQNSGTINVDGSGTGIAFMAADGGISVNDLDLSRSSGLTINVLGSGGTGILANTADDATVQSAVSVNVTAADGGSALVVNNNAKQVEQTGVLRSASTTAAVVDAAKVSTFINTGDIIAASNTALAMAFDDGVDTVMRNGSGGVIQGVIALNNGNNSLYLDDASTLTGTATLGDGNNSVTLTGTARADTVIAGSGDNTFTVKGKGAVFNLLDGGMGSNDTLVFDAAVHRLTSASTIQNFERVALKNNSLLTLDEALVLTDGGIAAGGVDVELGSELAVKPSVAGDFTFDPALTGQGRVSVSLDSSQSDFAFTGNTGSDFAGTLKLGTSHFQLEGDNTSSLTQAALVAGNGSVVTVGTGEQQLGGLSFDGGTVQFGAVMPGDIIADNHIITSADGTLDIGGKGTVQVTLGGGVINHVPASLSKKSLMEQDDATTLVQLAGADGTVKGTGGQLNLVDENGNVISDVQQLDIVQDGNTVAKGTWDYQMVSSSDGITSDGLYIAYGLKEVELLGTGENALTLAVGADAQGLQTDLRVKVTGSGDLAIDTGNGQTVSLSNGGNDYTGATSVFSGTLRLDADNALGLTSAVNVAADSVLDMHGSLQTAGALNTEAGSQVMLNDGSHLTLSDAQREAGNNDAGTIAGNTLTGTGELEVLSGELHVDGANSGYTGDVALNGGANAILNDVLGLGGSGTVEMTSANDTLTLSDGAAGALTKTLAGNGRVALKGDADITLAADNSEFSGLFALESGTQLAAQGPEQVGQASIENHGNLVLNNEAAWTVENHISGTGNLIKDGRGNVTLTQSAAQYTGSTDVNTGTLILGDADNAVMLASSAVNVASGALFGGYGSTAGDVNNLGSFVLGEHGVISDTTLQFTVGGNLTNAGTVLIGQSGGSAGNTLHVSGDYVGNNGTLNLNTVLGDDNSATDRMVIGGSTSGNTNVSITNAGGSGASTLHGIELITVGGKSDGEFTQSGRIVAGAYDYRLTRGQGSNAANWYLVSRDTTLVTPDPEPEPGTDPDTGSGTDPDTGSQPKPDWIRPEASLYGVNMAAANTLFTHRLHDRLGETHYVDALTGEKKVTSMWLRNVGGHTRSKDSSGQMNTQSNRYVMQMGGDIAQWSSNDDNRYHLGVMAGYANQKSNARNHLNGNKADSSINGYSLGLYGTWLQDNEAKTGAWLDTWLLYNWFDNTVRGKSASSASYKSKGFTASVEGGYTWKLGERDERTAYYIQPKAQAIWMGVKADDLTESNGTRVTGEGDGNIQTRLGARAFIKGNSTLDDAKERTFEPFIEANWIHNTETFGATLNGVRVNQAGTRNIGELKVGVEGQLSRNVNLWGNVAQQVGDDGYSDSSAMLGLKVSF